MRMRRSRWTAIGALVAVTVASGGVMMLRASGAQSSFVPVTPTRVLDTRINIGLVGTFVSDTARLLTVTGFVATPSGSQLVVPTGATAVVMNVTAVAPTAGGFVSVRPGNASGPVTTSNLNFAAGTVVPNAVTVELPPAGNLNLYYLGSPGSTTHLLIDVVGYYIVGDAGAAGAPGANGVAGVQYGRQVAYTRDLDVGFQGSQPSVAIGADGLPLIANRDDLAGAEPDLRVTHCNDTACASSTSTLVEADTGWYAALAIGSDGLPIIAHTNSNSDDLRVTHCSDLACIASTHTTFTTIGINDSGNPSIAIGTDGLAIVVHRASTGGFRLTHCENVLCTSAIETHYGTGANVGLTPSIAIGSDGLAIVAHRDGTNADLRVLHCNNVGCTTATDAAIDTAGDVGNDPSIAIGTDGFAIIAHRVETDRDLRVSHCSNISCTTATSTTVDVLNDRIGYETAMTIAPNGFAIVAHRNESTSNVRLTSCSNVDCSLATTVEVVTAGADGQNPSIVIGRDGQVLVVHRAAVTNGLRVTKVQHMSWTANGWES